MTGISVRSAKKRESVLVAPMMQDYLAEFAAFDTVEQDGNGQYLYPYFSHYWEDPNRYPFLFRLGDELVGFALLRFEADPLTGIEMMEMAEFYVIPAFRRRGIGREAAMALWNLFPGRWIVRVLRSNREAYPFWKQAITDYTSTNYSELPPETAVGGFYAFVFDSAADADLPDDMEPDLLDY